MTSIVEIKRLVNGYALFVDDAVVVGLPYFKTLQSALRKAKSIYPQRSTQLMISPDKKWASYATDEIPMRKNPRPKQKGRAYSSGRKLRVKRGVGTEPYRTRLLVDPRKMKRAFRKSGYRVNPRINGINRTWQTFAGGTGAHHGSSYAMYLENRAMFDINPPQRRGGSYSLKSFGVTAPHWVHHGSFRSPQAAKAEAKRILESGEGAQRFARNPGKSRAFLHVAKTAHRPTFRVGVKTDFGKVHYFDQAFHSMQKARKVAQASANAARAVYVIKKVKA